MNYCNKLYTIRISLGALIMLFLIASPLYPMGKKQKDAEPMEGPEVWIHNGLEGFSKGQFDNAGGNLYVNANGVIEMINNLDVNSDGYVDLVLANDHDRIERGPTWAYSTDQGPGENWKRHEMSADSGWMSRVIDVDGDGHNDLVTVNSQNGVSSELNSYIYWGGPEGPEASRTDLPTIGAFDVTPLDINGDGKLDLLFPSAWIDGHNPAIPRLVHVYIQSENRMFNDEGARYGMIATGALGIATGDLNNDEYADIVLASYRKGQNDLNTESKIFWGTAEGVNAKEPLTLPTYGARQVIIEDLNQDGSKDLTFCGSAQVRLYWNESGKIDRENPVIIGAKGQSGEFSSSVIRAEIADVDADGIPDLLIATSDGVQIRSGDSVEKMKALIDVKNSRWVTAADLDGDSLPELIISKNFDGNEFDIQSPIYWNGPDGYSDDRTSWVHTMGVVGNTAGDLDGDGKPEVIFNNVLNGHVHSIPSYVYLGNKNADYSEDNRLEFQNGHSSIALVTDLNSDGYPEVVFAISNGFRIYSGGANGPKLNESTDINYENEFHIGDLKAVDFNRDGYLDILAVAFGAGLGENDPDTTSSIFYGSPSGFSSDRSDSDSLYNRGDKCAVGDVNNDGYIDILFHDKRNFIRIYLGNADGFSKERKWEVPCHGLEDSAGVNVADINDDGWLDIIVGILGHRRRHQDTLRIHYGSPDGYQEDNIQELMSGYSAIFTGIADYNNDDNLDILVTAYANPTSRTPPAQLFYGNGKRIDFDHPVDLPGYAAGAVTQADLNQDGWIDIALGCHRNDIGHQVDSLIYWNSSDGFDKNKVSGFPGLGPHGMTSFDRGNGFTRKPEENYISPAYNLGNRKARRLHWDSKETELLKIKFQLRWGDTEASLENATWMGPEGEASFYESSGKTIEGIPSDAPWLQYKATLISPYGCGSPRLKAVRIES